MGKDIKLDAQTRAEGSATKLRSEGFVPAVVYGSGSENKNIGIKKVQLEKIYARLGETSLIDLKIDNGEALKVIIKDTQKDPLRNNITHIDFYVVDMKKPIDVTLPLRFTGEAKAVKELGGTLVTNLDAIEVRCLPGDLMESFDVDLSILNTFEDSINVRDLKLPAGIEILSNLDGVVASVIMPQVEEPEKPAEEGADEKKGEEAKGGKDQENKEEKK
ncbi:MAG: 50S ribosomal protein L25 [Candidatus Falkowbacteria bacterium]